MQKQLVRATAEQRTAAFEQLLPHVVLLSSHLYANYVMSVVQYFLSCIISGFVFHYASAKTIHVSQPSTVRLKLCRQKLCEYGTREQREQIADALKGLTFEMSMQTFGCRVMQKVLECVDAQRQESIANEVSIVHLPACRM